MLITGTVRTARSMGPYANAPDDVKPAITEDHRSTSIKELCIKITLLMPTRIHILMTIFKDSAPGKFSVRKIRAEIQRTPKRGIARLHGL